MRQNGTKRNMGAAVIIVVAAVIGVVGWKKLNSQPQADKVEPPAAVEKREEVSVEEPVLANSAEKVTENDSSVAENANVKPEITLEDLIASAREWAPAYTDWIGKEAPDFVLRGLDGREQGLSGFQGKNVLLIFWATWCGPCRMEIPHIIALRNTVSEDELAIMAISDENAAALSQFVSANPRINYGIYPAVRGQLPRPFSSIASIPCSFFIDKEGKIRLATVGTLSIGTIKAIFRTF